MAIKNKNAREKSLNDSVNGNEQMRKMQTLLDVSRQMAVFEVLDDMLRVLVDMVIKEVGAERGTLFLNDEATGELYSRVALGNLEQEIRIPNNSAFDPISDLSPEDISPEPASQAEGMGSDIHI